MKPLTTIHTDDDQEIQLPTKWAICDRCRGEGFVSKIPGAIGSDTLDEWFGDGEERYEFIEEYTRRGGIYDDVCPDCENGKVKVVDEDLLKPEHKKLWLQQQAEEYESWAIQQQEIAMGA
jgi:hypothetical protein